MKAPPTGGSENGKGAAKGKGVEVDHSPTPQPVRGVQAIGERAWKKFPVSPFHPQG